jgi:hypothetical protein
MGRIAAVLTEHGALPQRKILDIAQGNREGLIRALRCLIDNGHVSHKTPQQLVKPYPPERASL